MGERVPVISHISGMPDRFQQVAENCFGGPMIEIRIAHAREVAEPVGLFPGELLISVSFRSIDLSNPSRDRDILISR